MAAIAILLWRISLKNSLRVEAGVYTYSLRGRQWGSKEDKALKRQRVWARKIGGHTGWCNLRTYSNKVRNEIEEEE